MGLLSRGEGQKKVNAAQVGTNAGATATIAGVTGNKIVVTHISGSGDAAALVTLEIPTGTVKWRKRFAAAFNFESDFQFGEYEGADADAVSVKISASTSNCEANVAGLQVSSG